MDSQTADTSLIEMMQDLILETDDVEEFLNELARHAATSIAIDVEVLCGITLRRQKRATTVASNNERARRMDEIQYKFEEGPCLEASASQSRVLIEDTRLEKRWPEYMGAVNEHGMRSILAVPFELEASAKAALNLYSSEPRAFGDAAIKTAEVYARQTSKALLLALRLAQRNETMLDLKAAMNSRTSIDLAVGIVMGQNQCSQEVAAAILKSASSTRNIKLRDLAESIVAATGKDGAKTHFDE